MSTSYCRKVKVIRIHPLGSLKVGTKFCWKSPVSCWDVTVLTEVFRAMSPAKNEKTNWRKENKKTELQVYKSNWKREWLFQTSILCPQILPWSFALAVASWYIYHSPASGVPTLPDRKLSHPQKILTSAHTALTTPATTMLDRWYHGDSRHRLAVVSERRSYLLCECLYQQRWLITLGPD